MTGVSDADYDGAPTKDGYSPVGGSALLGTSGHSILSVIIPNYNHAHYLPTALESILGQAVSPIEVLIYDDASTDDSVRVIQELCRRHQNIRLVCNPENLGPVHGMNRGLEIASGDYIFFMAADDVILPGFFERCLGLLARYPDAALCSTLSRIIDETGTDHGEYPSPLVRRHEAFLNPVNSLRILRSHGPWFMGNTTVYRRRLLMAAGGFDPSLRSFCDGFIAQVLALRHGACYIPEPLACWRRTRTGYAATDNSVWQQRLQIREHAAQVMRTTFRDTFPENYVVHWERQSRLAAGVAGWRAVRRRQEEMLAELLGRLPPKSGLADTCLLSCLRVLLAAQTLCIRFYLFLRYSGVTVWLRQTLARMQL